MLSRKWKMCITGTKEIQCDQRRASQSASFLRTHTCAQIGQRHHSQRQETEPFITRAASGKRWSSAQVTLSNAVANLADVVIETLRICNHGIIVQVDPAAQPNGTSDDKRLDDIIKVVVDVSKHQQTSMIFVGSTTNSMPSPRSGASRLIH